MATSNPLSVSVRSESDGGFTLTIPCSLVWEWRDKSPRVPLINQKIKCLQLREDCEGLETRFKAKVHRLSSKVKSKNGRAKLTYLSNEYCEFHVLSNEIVSVIDLEKKIDQLAEESDKKDHVVEDLREELKSSKCQLPTTSKAVPVNHGKGYDEVQPRQKKRKLQAIKSAAEQALNFVKSFGLNVDKIVLKSPSDNVVEVSFGSLPCSSSTCSTSNVAKLNDRLHGMQDETLYLLDKFGVSDECYHELAMLYPQLPRLYELKDLRRAVGSCINLEPLPTPKYHGAFRPLKPYLIEVPSHEQNFTWDNVSVQLKFSGDGAAFTANNSNYVLFSFSLPTLSSDALTGSGNHTFAAAKCTERYDEMKDALGSVFYEMNELIADKEIVIDGRCIKLDIVLGGDMKFILIVLGLNAAHSNYACVWCNIHKKARYNL